MFEFEKLTVFEKAVELSAAIGQFVDGHDFHENVSTQLKKASNQTVVEIAHASARLNIAERKSKFENARSCVHEAAAVLILLHKDKQLPNEEFEELYKAMNDLSRMLFRLVRKTSPSKEIVSNSTEANAVEA